MKSPRSKIHLCDLDEPLLAFHDIQCRCGIVLHSAVAKFMEANDLPESTKPYSWPHTLGICHKCAGSLSEKGNERFYCYGLQEGEEAMQQKREEEELVA